MPSPDDYSRSIGQLTGNSQDAQQGPPDDDTGDQDANTDPQGGITPSDLKRAKKVDLITLPADVPGTNCGNCQWMDDDGDHCDHMQVDMDVNERNCCSLWENPDMIRAWEQKGGQNGQQPAT